MCTPACAKCSLYTERKSPVSCPVQHLNYRVHLTLYNLRIEDNATYPRIQFIFCDKFNVGVPAKFAASLT